MNSNDFLQVKPAAGLVVIDPETGRPLPADGDKVAPSTYWLRRLEDGDVLEVEAPADKKPKPSRGDSAAEPRTSA